MQSVANVLADAIERGRVGEKLREREAMFRQIAENIGAVLFMTNAGEERVYYVNPAYAKVWCRSVESLYRAPLSWLDAVHDEDRPRARAALARMATSGHFDEEFRIVCPDGSIRWVHDRVFPVPDHYGVDRVVGIAEDVTAIKLAEERARALLIEQAARTAAEAGVRAREQILAFVSHDLRNPLSAVALGAELVRSRADDPIAVRGVETIDWAVQRMQRLIEDLLVAAKMDAGGFAVATAPSELGPILREVEATHASEARRRQLVLEVDAPAVLPRVCVDRDRVVQALSNLVGNAMKFTSEEGRITIRARALSGEVVVRVEDTGRGIAEADLPRLFDRFWQSEKADDRGAGLGLAITKGIVEAHHGRILGDEPAGRGEHVLVHPPDRGSRRSELLRCARLRAALTTAGSSHEVEAVGRERLGDGLLVEELEQVDSRSSARWP